jgi:DNA-3-methyladenine glycosylase II
VVASARGLKKALDHLRRHERLARVMERVGQKPPPPRADHSHFWALARAITFQQLSGKAAATIFGRVVDAVGGTLAPEALLDASDATLRAAGLSRQKIVYLRDLATHAANGTLPLATIHELPDEQVITAIRAVKGCGLWTAQMFLMFRLGRPDVFPVHDLGIRKAMQELFRLRALPVPAKVEKLAEPWRPYRTIASWYLWRSLEVETP